MPGSHKLHRRPQYEHGEQLAAMRNAIPVETPAGSIVLFRKIDPRTFSILRARVATSSKITRKAVRW